MSREELAMELRDAAGALTQERLDDELAGILPAEELAGLVPRLTAAIMKIAEQLDESSTEVPATGGDARTGEQS